MSKPYDATSKGLMDNNPRPWARLAGIHIEDDFEILNVDLSTVTSAADFLIGLYTRPPRVWSAKWKRKLRGIIHIEFVSAHQKNLIREVFARFGLLHLKYKVGVRSILILLEPDAFRSSMTGSYQVRFQGQKTGEIAYTIIKVWEYKVEDFLNMEPQLMPLAVLSHEVKTLDDVEPVLHRLHDKLVEKLRNDIEKIKLFWTAAEVLLGLKFKKAADKARIRTQTRSVLEVRDSVIYQDILKEGRLEGRLGGRINSLLNVGTSLFGPPNEGERVALEAIQNIHRLNRMTNRIAKVASWSEVLAIK